MCLHLNLWLNPFSYFFDFSLRSCTILNNLFFHVHTGSLNKAFALLPHPSAWQNPHNKI